MLPRAARLIFDAQLRQLGAKDSILVQPNTGGTGKDSFPETVKAKG